MTCEYCYQTNQKWFPSVPCKTFICTNPERVKHIKHDKAGWHSRYVNGRNDIVEVRSIVCNNRDCSDFVYGGPDDKMWNDSFVDDWLSLISDVDLGGDLDSVL